MLIPKRVSLPKDKVDKKKPIAFRITNEITDEFKALCKKNKFKQSEIIENAMKLAIEEMKGIKDA